MNERRRSNPEDLPERDEWQEAAWEEEAQASAELPVEETGGESQYSLDEAGRATPSPFRRRQRPYRLEPLNPPASGEELGRRYLEGATTEPAQADKERAEAGDIEARPIADYITED